MTRHICKICGYPVKWRWTHLRSKHKIESITIGGKTFTLRKFRGDANWKRLAPLQLRQFFKRYI